MVYAVAPLAGWLVAGTLKFVVNSVRRRGFGFSEIGFGGFPSTHTAVVAAPMFLIGMREGWNTPAFSVAAALLLIVVIDAVSLRRQIGFHAVRLNLLMQGRAEHAPVRERIGHRAGEILGGVLTGMAVGYALSVVGG